MGRMRLLRLRQARLQQQQEKSSQRKELALVGFAVAVIIGIMAWHSPDMLQSWYAREYIYPNK